MPEPESAIFSLGPSRRFPSMEWWSQQDIWRGCASRDTVCWFAKEKELLLSHDFARVWSSCKMEAPRSERFNVFLIIALFPCYLAPHPAKYSHQRYTLTLNLELSVGIDRWLPKPRTSSATCILALNVCVEFTRLNAFMTDSEP